MATVNDILKIAKAEIGVKESPANSNNVKYNTWYYGKSVQGTAYPWCAAFISWVFSQVDSSLIKKSASCMEIGNWFKSNNQWKTNNPQPGDVVFFKFNTNSRWANHIGLVEFVNADGSINTIEGNTSISSDDNGGSVMRRTRKNNIVGYGVPKYDSKSNPYIVTSTTIRGIDVSAYQGNIDWRRVKESGIQFAILRSTLKSGKPDSKFTEYLKGCDNNKIDVSVYKYSYALTETQSIAEANTVISLLNGRKCKIWLDLEDESQTQLGKHGILKIANAFIKTCEDKGYSVGIYCNLNWIKNYIDDSLKKYDLWIARYGKNSGQLEDKYKPNVNEKIWQYTSRGQVSGINGNVDLNILYSTNNSSNNSSSTQTIKNIVKVKTTLNVRNKPNGTVIDKLKNGTEVDISNYQNGWFEIGKDRWVSADYIHNIYGTVTANILNIRSGAGTNYQDIGDLNKNENVRVLKESNGWYLVLCGTRYGWASAKYIQLI